MNQLFHRSRNVFDRHVGVNAVLIEQIDDIGLEAFQRGLSDFLDVLRPAVQDAPTCFTLGGRSEPELRGDRYLPTKRDEGFSHQFFVRVRAIYLCRIEECDAAFDSRSNQ